MPLLLPFFKFFVNDWLNSEKIALMSHAQIGAYIMLLAKCWTQETCTLPGELTTLRTLIQWKGTDQELSCVLTCFTPTKRPKGRLVNKRLYTEWQAAMLRTRRLQEGGKKGAQTRWADPSTPLNHTPLPPTPCELGPMPPELKSLIAKIGGGKLHD